MVVVVVVVGVAVTIVVVAATNKSLQSNKQPEKKFRFFSVIKMCSHLFDN